MSEENDIYIIAFLTKKDHSDARVPLDENGVTGRASFVYNSRIGTTQYVPFALYCFDMKNAETPQKDRRLYDPESGSILWQNWEGWSWPTQAKAEREGFAYEKNEPLTGQRGVIMTWPGASDPNFYSFVARHGSPGCQPGILTVDTKNKRYKVQPIHSIEELDALRAQRDTFDYFTGEFEYVGYGERIVNSHIARLIGNAGRSLTELFHQFSAPPEDQSKNPYQSPQGIDEKGDTGA